MRRSVKVVLCMAVLLMLVLCVWHWNRSSARPSAFPLSLTALEQIDSGQIWFEDKDGEIYVRVTDPFGDAHIHRLDCGDIPREKAIEILKARQAELQETDAQR
ncbi:MAG: hypothetical protein JXB13_09545 [Phycisphaerae bacterium]|nr:hypothetical protein [Phycisphaerae bacterium]